MSESKVNQVFCDSVVGINITNSTARLYLAQIDPVTLLSKEDNSEQKVDASISHCMILPLTAVLELLKICEELSEAEVIKNISRHSSNGLVHDSTNG